MTKNMSSANTCSPQASDTDFLMRTTNIMSELPALLLRRGNDTTNAIDSAFAQVGELLAVSRVYLMDEKDGRYLRNSTEWLNTEIESTVGAMPLHDLENEIPSLKPLICKRPVYGEHARNLPPDLKHLWNNKREAESILLAPLHKDDDWIGLVGFDSCGQERNWFRIEEAIIRMLADLIAAAYEHREIQQMRKKFSVIRTIITNDQQTPWDEALEDMLVKNQPVSLREFERRFITKILEMYNGNKLRAAKHLDLTWPALDRRCKKLGITVKRKI